MNFKLRAMIGIFIVVIAVLLLTACFFTSVPSSALDLPSGVNIIKFSVDLPLLIVGFLTFWLLWLMGYQLG